MHEYAGNLHIHTRYSDGEKWHKELAHDAARAGLDFIVVTDHNVWVQGVEGYYDFPEGRVLLLTGEEVHDPRRRPQANHFLVYGTEQEMSPYAREPQELIQATNTAGGCGFLELGEGQVSSHSGYFSGKTPAAGRGRLMTFCAHFGEEALPQYR